MKLSYLFVIAVFGLVGFLAIDNTTVDFSKDDPEGIQFFQGTLQEALKASAVSGKPVFIDVYATWCGPCKRLKTKTFADKSVGDFFNANFINVALDGEQPEGNKFMKENQIGSYPTLIFMRADGRELRRVVGFQSVKELLSVGNQVTMTNKNP